MDKVVMPKLNHSPQTLGDDDQQENDILRENSHTNDSISTLN